MTPPPRTVVLLATYNGADFLDEQIESIAAQTVPAIDVLASDDGSTDGTRERLETWAARWSKGRFRVLEGPRAGFAENFRALLLAAPDDAAHYAFADQDDIWHPDKLEVATGRISGRAAPCLYGGRTELVDIRGARLGHSPIFPNPPSFSNALVQSIAGGNTMVWNRPAQDLLARASARTGFVTHDWWAYILITAAGGEVIYDPEPRIAYRQHTGNLVGSNRGWRAQRLRLRGLIRGRFRSWCDANLAGLAACSDMIEPAAAETLAHFAAARRTPLPARLVHLMRSGVYRQTVSGHLGLYLACLIGRI
ncbi:MAG: glycosyltransferase family 2 protein [Pseudomonadota bacterium]